MADLALPVIIDSTMLVSFRSCPRQFYNTFVLNKAKYDRSIHLTAGGAFAAGLEEYRLAHFADSAPKDVCYQRAIAAACVRWGDADPLPLDPETKGETYEAKNLLNILYALDRYFHTYPPELDRLQPMPSTIGGKTSFEHSFAIPLDDDKFPAHPIGEPFVYHGRMDTRGFYDQYRVFSDEKTTKALGKKWSNQWMLRNQFMGYAWAMRELGQPERACLVRGICIQKTQIRFVDCLQLYPEHLLDSFEESLAHDLTLMRHYHENDFWPQRFGEACTSYGGCDFRETCLARPSLQPYALETYGARSWDPASPYQRARVLEAWSNAREAA
jgi:hypothetical protein